MGTGPTPLRVVIAGGGTGGHVFPGIALAEEVVAHAGHVHFVGTARGLEARLVPAKGWSLSLLDVEGIKGRGIRGLVRALVRVPTACFQSRTILRAFSPDVVVGVGGYASGPVVATAAILGIPTAILEQNSIPGLTNSMLGRLVRRVFLSFDDVRKRFPPDKVRLVGNPIRKQLIADVRNTTGRNEAYPRLLVFGGSQGARAINDAMIAAAPSLVGRLMGLRIWHQTGARDQSRVRDAYASVGIDVRVDAFIEDMAKAYGFADVVLCRAGATSLAELAVVAKPALLVPFPHATDDHQSWNARVLVERGAARMLAETQLEATALVDVLVEMLTDREALGRMAKAMGSQARPDAAAHIYAELCRLV